MVMYSIHPVQITRFSTVEGVYVECSHQMIIIQWYYLRIATSWFQVTRTSENKLIPNYLEIW